MKALVMTAEYGTALYLDGTLTATWDTAESSEYIRKQLMSILPETATVSDQAWDGAEWPKSLPKPAVVKKAAPSPTAH